VNLEQIDMKPLPPPPSTARQHTSSTGLHRYPCSSTTYVQQTRRQEIRSSGLNSTRSG